MALIPNDELVAAAWLAAAVDGLTAAKVATTLPDTPWTDNEFVQIMQVGGTPDIHLPLPEPVISVNCFANVPGSAKPPWGHANQLAMKIWKACYAKLYNPDTSVVVAMPSGYGSAIVRTVAPVSQPRRIPSDPSQFAVYNIDLQFSWYPASETFA